MHHIYYTFKVSVIEENADSILAIGVQKQGILAIGTI